MQANASARFDCARALRRGEQSVSVVPGALPAARMAMMENAAHTIAWKEDGVLCADFVANKE